MREMIFLRVMLLLAALGLTQLATAQQTLFQRDTLRNAPGDTLRLSHGFLTPFSETIETDAVQLSKAQYDINYLDGWVLIKNPNVRDSLSMVSYRYFPNGLRKEISLRKLSITVDTATREQQVDVIYDEQFQAKEQVFFPSDRIRKSGSLSRGLTVGNNRGVALNSGLRLQLEGDLGDGLKIVGAITDENIPIQPDGTTQQISDFDRVFIKLMKDGYGLTMGDYEVVQRNTRFGNYYRNVQGVRFAKEEGNTRFSVSGAVAKGKFHTNSFFGQDGVAGPYRLTGQNGERFFITLAGSEKVYLDGNLLIRGEANDYVINYNTAEVFFTAKHVITAQTRIVIDFEYNDQYYNRSLLVAKVSHQVKDRMRVQFSYARDADNANAPFNDRESFINVRDTLSRVGDVEGFAQTSGVDTLGPGDPRPPYLRRDTLVNGTLYERYLYAPNVDTARFNLVCSRVGSRQGMYRINPAIQGLIVYEWVGPDSLGVPLGDYAPIRQWALPRLLQVANAKVEYEISEYAKFYSETGLSLEDNNRLSSAGDGDNGGIANRSGFQINDLPIGDSMHLSLDVYQQFVSKRYENLDRVYQMEYGRVWNFDDSLDIRSNEIISSGGFLGVRDL
ncbi:MAG: hypothetical protein AAF206_22085 [Bacteroidota bacterium]